MRYLPVLVMIISVPSSLNLRQRSSFSSLTEISLLDPVVPATLLRPEIIKSFSTRASMMQCLKLKLNKFSVKLLLLNTGLLEYGDLGIMKDLKS